MKKILTLCFCLALGLSSSAQMADNSICPNFTGVDLDGNTHDLYTYLDQGYTVIVDVFATWCGPCWSYSQQGHLDDLYNNYGPGTTEDRVIVLGIEGDGSTTLADLNGTGGNTTGNWVAITDYPIIDNAAIADLLEISYYPTIYRICPNRVIVEQGQDTQSQIWAAVQTCPVADSPHDASLVTSTETLIACAGAPVDLIARLQNMGTNSLTNAVIQAKQGATILGSTNWTGNLGTYGFEEVVVTNATFSSNTTITYEITTTDDDASNNTTNGSVSASDDELGTQVVLELKTDNYGSETDWELVQNGVIVAQDPPGAYANNQVYTYTWNLPDLTCFVFKIYDAYGDGICCDFGNGYYKLLANGIPVIQGGAFDSEAFHPFKTNLAIGMSEMHANGLAIYPNPTTGNVTVSFAPAAKADLDVFNVLGERVMGMQLTGPQADLSLSELNSGIYYFNLTADGATTTRKVTVNK